MANYNQPYQNNNKNHDNTEVISWILIAICFTVAWPLGVLLLISKLRDNKSGGKTKRTTVNSRPQYQQPQYQQPQYQQPPVQQAQAQPSRVRKTSAPREIMAQKLTRTPIPSAGKSLWMRRMTARFFLSATAVTEQVLII